MKHFKLLKSFLLALIAAMLPQLASAYDFMVDGLCYNINDDGTSVTVTYETTSSPRYSDLSGELNIPENVTYNGASYSVTSIGGNAFTGCTGLTSVEIPNSVTSIGDRVFLNCSGLTSVTIPNSVTKIGKGAFVGSGLTSITLPESLTVLGTGAFQRCESLTLVIWNAKNCRYPAGSFTLFTEETQLEYIIFGEEVETIGGSGTLFSLAINESTEVVWNAVNCTAIINNSFGSALKKITIGNEVKIIPNNLCAGCSGLTSVTIPNSVTSIGDRAFLNCSGLTSVTIPNSVTSIGNDAFSGCSGLTSVTIPNSVTSIGEWAFYGCSGLTKVNINSLEAWCNIDFGGWGANPLSYALNLYLNDSVITTLVIPNSVTEIGSWAFVGCTGLTLVTIGNSVTSIGDNAFEYCTGLTSVTIPNSVTSIGNATFRDCSGLTSMVVESGNPKYDSRNNCNAIIETASNTLISGCKNTIIPNSVTSIGNYAFYGCTGLTSVTIPNSVTSIGEDAFGFCENLTSVTIPNSVTEIGGSAFWTCTGLTSVTIPNSVTSIGKWAFRFCSGLTLVIWNAKNCNVYTATFSDCTSLSSFVFGDEVEQIPANLCNGITGLTSVTIPNTVTSIGGNAFTGCTGLTSVTIPNSVTSINYGAFQNCTGLTSVTIPNSVTSIGVSAFRYCRGLTSLTLTGHGDCVFNNSAHQGLMYIIPQVKTVNIGSEITSLGDFGFIPDIVNAHASLPPTCQEGTFAYYDGELHVPVASATTYSTADYWQNFDDFANDLTEKVTLSHSSAIMKQYSTLPLTASTTPGGGLVRWTTSNPAVARVSDEGVVTAVGAGECDIFASLETNYAVYASCHINVRGLDGDVNGDGVVTAADITELYNYLLNGSTTYLSTSDITGDGVVTAADVTAIYDILLGNRKD